jgi:hypothetical protein
MKKFKITKYANPLLYGSEVDEILEGISPYSSELRGKCESWADKLDEGDVKRRFGWLPKNKETPQNPSIQYMKWALAEAAIGILFYQGCKY